MSHGDKKYPCLVGIGINEIKYVDLFHSLEIYVHDSLSKDLQYVLDMKSNFFNLDSFLLVLIDLVWLMQKEIFPGKPIFQSQGLN